MDNEESVAYHLKMATKISGKEVADTVKNRSLLVQSVLAVLYHVAFIVLAFVFMHGESETLFKLGFVIVPIYILATFFYNISKYIPWQVFFIFTGGALVEFILNAAHIIPEDSSIVLRGFDQSLWCAYIVLQVIVMFLFTLIPYLVYLRKRANL